MILYCCNISINTEGFKCIDNQIDFDTLLKNGFDEFNDGVIIDAELNWEPYKYVDFYGFELIKQIRTDFRYKGPIVVCSPMQEEYFAVNGCHAFKSKVINAPCHYFIEIIPEEDYIEKTIEVLKTANWLDDVTLEQSVFCYFSVRDYVGTLLHDLRNEDRNIQSISDFERIIGYYFERLFKQPLENTKKQKLLRIKTEIIEEFQNKKLNNEELKSSFRELIDSKAKQIKILFDKAILNKENKIYYRYPWEVLYIEDNDNQRKELINLFSEKKIICHSACNYNEAEDIINNENRNHKYNIGAIIADYRLLKSGSVTKEEDIQGYTALDKIRKNAKRPIAYFVLTSKETTIKEIAGMSLQFKPQWFSKQDVLQKGGGFNLFFNEVESKANAMYVGAMFQPKIDPWTEKPTKTNTKKRISYSEYYKHHLTDFGYYESSEHIINEEANLFIKNVLSNILNHSYEWRGTLIDKAGDLYNDLSKFRKKILTGRRIVLGLVYLYNKQGKRLENYQIYNFLERRIEGVKDKEISDNAEFELVKNTFGTLMNTLGLPEKDLKNLIPDPNRTINYGEIQILKEEINFLHEYYGYELSIDNILEMIKIDDDIVCFFDDLEDLLNNYDIKIDSLSELTLDMSDNPDISENKLNHIFKEIILAIKSSNNRNLTSNFSNIISNYRKERPDSKMNPLLEKIQL